MVWNFFKHDYQCGTEECTLVSAVRGQECCDSGGIPICSGTCNQGSTTEAITSYLQKIEPSYKRYPGVPEEKLYDAVQKSPVIVILYLNNLPAHAIVIGGVQCNSDGSHSFLVGDPATVYGMQALPYHQIISYHKFYVWGDTIAQ